MREIQDDGDSPVRAVQIEAVQIKSDKNRLVTVKPNIVASPKAAANSL